MWKLNKMRQPIPYTINAWPYQQAEPVQTYSHISILAKGLLAPYLNGNLNGTYGACLLQVLSNNENKRKKKIL